MRVFRQTDVVSKLKTSRTNSTFGFLPTHKPTLKKPKELFFLPTLERNEKNRKLNKKKERILND
jgi:hypothetical protein